MRYSVFKILFALLLFSSNVIAQKTKEPWNNNQLMAPSVLAEKINDHNAANILIVTIGPDALIKGSIDIGPGKEAENILKLKQFLKDKSREKEVVIYCGCCPFDKCPNIRPAFNVLKQMDFKYPKLLNLPKNIKADWLDKNYPIAE